MLLGSYCEIVLFASYYKLCIVYDGAETSDTLKMLKQPLSNPERPRIRKASIFSSEVYYSRNARIFQPHMLTVLPHAVLHCAVRFELHLPAFRILTLIILLLTFRHAEQHFADAVLDVELERD